MKPVLSLTLAAVAMTAMACSPKSSDPKAEAPMAPTASSAGAAPAAVSPPATVPQAADARVLKLSGLGPLKVGQPVPADGSWTAAGAATGGECHAVRSAAYPGVYALVEGGKVRRITVGAGSDVKLTEGLGVGAAESDVLKAFAGFRSEPHKYDAAPAKYLTAPNAAKSESALRFEIGADRTVKFLHVGSMPQLAYVEACG